MRWSTLKFMGGCAVSLAIGVASNTLTPWLPVPRPPVPQSAPNSPPADHAVPAPSTASNELPHAAPSPSSPVAAPRSPSESAQPAEHVLPPALHLPSVAAAASAAAREPARQPRRRPVAIASYARESTAAPSKNHGDQIADELDRQYGAPKPVLPPAHGSLEVIAMGNSRAIDLSPNALGPTNPRISQPSGTGETVTIRAPGFMTFDTANQTVYLRHAPSVSFVNCKGPLC
jgi:hypothetical protein